MRNSYPRNGGWCLDDSVWWVVEVGLGHGIRKAPRGAVEQTVLCVVAGVPRSLMRQLKQQAQEAEAEGNVILAEHYKTLMDKVIAGAVGGVVSVIYSEDPGADTVVAPPAHAYRGGVPQVLVTAKTPDYLLNTPPYIMPPPLKVGSGVVHVGRFPLGGDCVATLFDGDTGGQHMYIVGATGKGKSYLARYIFDQIKSLPVFIIDPKREWVVPGIPSIDLTSDFSFTPVVASHGVKWEQAVINLEAAIYNLLAQENGLERVSVEEYTQRATAIHRKLRELSEQTNRLTPRTVMSALKKYFDVDVNIPYLFQIEKTLDLVKALNAKQLLATQNPAQPTDTLLMAAALLYVLRVFSSNQQRVMIIEELSRFPATVYEPLLRMARSRNTAIVSVNQTLPASPDLLNQNRTILALDRQTAEQVSRITQIPAPLWIFDAGGYPAVMFDTAVSEAYPILRELAK